MKSIYQAATIAFAVILLGVAAVDATTVTWKGKGTATCRMVGMDLDSVTVPVWFGGTASDESGWWVYKNCYVRDPTNGVDFEITGFGDVTEGSERRDGSSAMAMAS